MRRRLAMRLVLALTVVVAVIELVFAAINVRTQKSELLDEIVLGADQLSRSLTGATWHAMLDDHREVAYQIMQTLGNRQGIASIRMLNKQGVVTFSTDPASARQVDKSAEACFVCHREGEPLSTVDVPSRARTFAAGDGTPMLGMITPIYNEPACSTAACHAHPASRKVIGVLDVTIDLAHVDRKVLGIKLRAILMSVTVFVLLTLSILVLTRRLVERPIAKLIDGARAVARMDLDRPVVIDRPEELKELADSFDSMRERLKAALAEINASAQDLERKVVERTEQLSLAQQHLMRHERLASLGQLAASVAHEINNPISGVLNLAMLMQRIVTEQGIPPGRVDDVRRYLKQVADETTRVGRIVSDLLAFSRRSKPMRKENDLNALITATVSLVHHKLELGRIDLDLQLAPSLPTVPCDRSQLQQVVMNLVMNAAEAMPSGGTLHVRTAVDATGRRVQLQVQDHGTGITPANLKRIFEPFFTTKEDGKGVGLGLAVVYGIVEEHRGTIDVTSRVGEGTTFTVHLPLEHGETESTEAEQPRSRVG
jgi:two-component system NtrC family sensor kinase